MIFLYASSAKVDSVNKNKLCKYQELFLRIMALSAVSFS